MNCNRAGIIDYRSTDVSSDRYGFDVSQRFLGWIIPFQLTRHEFLTLFERKLSSRVK